LGVYEILTNPVFICYAGRVHGGKRKTTVRCRAYFRLSVPS